MKARTNRPHTTITLQDLISGKVLVPAQDPADDPCSSVLSEWGINSRDYESRLAKTRTVKVWKRLSPDQRWLLIETVKAIVTAEDAKIAWNPKGNHGEYEAVARRAVAAARLADGLAKTFPPPWDGEKGPILALISQLVCFVRSAVYATTLDRDVALGMAKNLVHRLRDSFANNAEATPWLLLRSLAHLASGKTRFREDSSERTIRWYLADRSSHRSNPAAGYWNRNWSLIRRVSALLPPREGDDLEVLIKKILLKSK